MTTALCHVQPQVLQCGVLRQPDLGLHEIDAGHHLGDRLLDPSFAFASMKTKG